MRLSAAFVVCTDRMSGYCGFYQALGGGRLYRLSLLYALIIRMSTKIYCKSIKNYWNTEYECNRARNRKGQDKDKDPTRTDKKQKMEGQWTEIRNPDRVNSCCWGEYACYRSYGFFYRLYEISCAKNPPMIRSHQAVA